MTKQETIITDVATLQTLITSRNQWLRRTLIAALLANITLIVTVGKTMIMDHFELQSQGVVLSEHKTQLKDHEVRLVNTERQAWIESQRLLILEDKSKKIN